MRRILMILCIGVLATAALPAHAITEREATQMSILYRTGTDAGKRLIHEPGQCVVNAYCLTQVKKFVAMSDTLPLPPTALQKNQMQRYMRKSKAHRRKIALSTSQSEAARHGAKSLYCVFLASKIQIDHAVMFHGLNIPKVPMSDAFCMN